MTRMDELVQEAEERTKECGYAQAAASGEPFEFSFTVPRRFPGMNDYIDACVHKFKRARFKREATESVLLALGDTFPRFLPPVEVRIDCFEQDARRDADNVHGAACKFILDALQTAGVIENDSRRWLPQPPSGGVFTDKLFPRVEVTVRGRIKEG